MLQSCRRVCHVSHHQTLLIFSSLKISIEEQQWTHKMNATSSFLNVSIIDGYQQHSMATKLLPTASTAIGNILFAITTGNASLSPEDFEDVYDHPNSSIDLSILLLEGTKKHLLEGCLIISAISLVASFLVYCILSELRTVPGKCLMGLIVSELITDVLVVAALQLQPQTSACFVIGVLIHFFFLTIVSWTLTIGKLLLVYLIKSCSSDH